MEKFMGIDIGGTNIKIGIVGTNGNMEHKIKYPTVNLKKGEDFVHGFITILETEFGKHSEVQKIGIGIPGTLSKDRSKLLEITAIPVLNGVEMKKALQEKFPDKIFHLENDANAAALGEYYFAGTKIPENYIFVTLGTGVGGAAIINKDIFTGGWGNGMEIGHILSKNGKELEENIGKIGIMKRAKRLMKNKKTVLSGIKPLDPKKILQAAIDGDKVAGKIYTELAVFLGEGLVSTMRLLDINVILIGGGLSACYDFILDTLKDTIEEGLTPYYTSELQIKKAVLGNNAGIIGAASLCFK